MQDLLSGVFCNPPLKNCNSVRQKSEDSMDVQAAGNRCNTWEIKKTILYLQLTCCLCH